MGYTSSHDEEYEQPCEQPDLSSAIACALRIIGKRSLSASDMEKRLIDKGETPLAAKQTVEWLEEIGAIDDNKYADEIVRHYYSKGYGMARIRDELFRRGISREIWEDALDSISQMESGAQDYVEKKLKGSCDKDELRKVTNALCRRGFSYEEAREAVKSYLESVEEAN